MKIRYFIIPLFLLFTTVAFAQKGEYVVDQESNWQDRIYFGGGMGLSGGSGYTMISLSPIVGYMISNRLSGGVGITYQYYKSGDFSDNRYGGQLFMRMNVIKQIFAYGSYEFINYSTGFTLDGPRETVARLPLGIGMSQPLGNRSSINFLAAYDVLWDDQLRVYNSPWVFSVFFSL
ncbi:MAG: hypothetical protein DRI71_04175 [Bacteroidetes bacterium]|nr:MAG: hypothetical protein DRI71_04175 [Bacteroidota bacterium]